jgi:hypothetical protein
LEEERHPASSKNHNANSTQIQHFDLTSTNVRQFVAIVADEPPLSFRSFRDSGALYGISNPIFKTLKVVRSHWQRRAAQRADDADVPDLNSSLHDLNHPNPALTLLFKI